jgi:hypothetical protein
MWRCMRRCWAGMLGRESFGHRSSVENVCTHSIFLLFNLLICVQSRRAVVGANMLLPLVSSEKLKALPLRVRIHYTSQ